MTDQQEMAVQRQDTEWTDATPAPTEQDYRELQVQHDQLQSKYKAALDLLNELAADDCIPYIRGQEFLSRAKALLAGQVPAPAVQEGWQLVPVEPTQEMVSVAFEDEGCRIADGPTYARLLYAEMLAAAPKPEAKP